MRAWTRRRIVPATIVAVLPAPGVGPDHYPGSYRILHAQREMWPDTVHETGTSMTVALTEAVAAPDEAVIVA